MFSFKIIMYSLNFKYNIMSKYDKASFSKALPFDFETE